MTVVFDAQGTTDALANAATSVDFTNLTVGTGANRALVVTLAFSNQAITGLTVTWDNGGTNQACTLIGAINSGGINGRAVLYGLVAPTSGAKTLHVAWTGSTSVTVSAVAYTGVDQTGGTTSFAHFNSASASSGSSVSVTITSAVGNAVVASQAIGNTTFTSVNNTQVYIDNSPAVGSAAANRAVGAATVTMTGALPTSDDWAIVGVDIVAAAGAAVAGEYSTQIFRPKRSPWR